jgi:hypothetical protein
MPLWGEIFLGRKWFGLFWLWVSGAGMGWFWGLTGILGLGGDRQYSGRFVPSTSSGQALRTSLRRYTQRAKTARRGPRLRQSGSRFAGTDFRRLKLCAPSQKQIPGTFHPSGQKTPAGDPGLSQALV